MSQTVRNLAVTAKAIQTEIAKIVGPPEEGARASDPYSIVPSTIFKNSRGYIKKVVNQANGAYSQGWYDACAVMIRRLLETLIIEAYEAHGISDQIKNSSGDFLYLRDLVLKTTSCSSWNLSQRAKAALPKLKDLSDKSAHSRRYNAVRANLDMVKSDLRLVCEELLYIAGLRK
jgi:hypothetical protein